MIPIHLAPLRERKEDIPLLVHHFLKSFHSRGKSAVEVSSPAMEALLDYDYPGNVRELENLLERALILCDGKTIGPTDLHVTNPQLSKDAARPGTFKQAVGSAKEETERELTLNALRRTQWNRVHAAKVLGIDYKTLRRKIQQYALFPGREDMP